MDKRFLTIWGAVSVLGSFSSIGAKDPAAAAIAWAVIGFAAALMDSKIPAKN